MKKKLLLAFMTVIMLFTLASCSSQKGQDESGKAETISIKDMAGREVTVKSKIEKVYSSSPVGTSSMYVFDDKKVAGLNYELSKEEKQYTTDYYKSLPNLGGWYGKGQTGNVEEIMKAKPDIVLSTGKDQKAIESADALQKQLGIPVVLINDDFEKISETYNFLGKVLNDEARAKELSTYCDETISNAKKIAESIPEKDKVRVYYAEEAAGLNTDPSGSPHSKLIDLTGGINVADVKVTPGYGRTQVSMEQVIAWNPSLIIASVDNGYEGSGSYEAITKGSSWSKIKAVKDGKVYQTPTSPLNWFDRPPSVNTVIGVKWTQYILYPDKVNFDIKEETKKFYKLFYHVDITDKDVDSILEKAVVK